MRSARLPRVVQIIRRTTGPSPAGNPHHDDTVTAAATGNAAGNTADNAAGGGPAARQSYRILTGSKGSASRV